MNYAQPEALEYHMLVSKSYRHSRLLKVCPSLLCVVPAITVVMFVVWMCYRLWKLEM